MYICHRSIINLRIKRLSCNGTSRLWKIIPIPHTSPPSRPVSSPPPGRWPSEKPSPRWGARRPAPRWRTGPPPSPSGRWSSASSCPGGRCPWRRRCSSAEAADAAASQANTSSVKSQEWMLFNSPEKINGRKCVCKQPVWTWSIIQCFTTQLLHTSMYAFSLIRESACH